MRRQRAEGQSPAELFWASGHQRQCSRRSALRAKSEFSCWWGDAGRCSPKSTTPILYKRTAGCNAMTSLKGHLLVATPELLAPIFTHSVILMLDHSEGGAAGLIINRPTEATVTAIAEQVFEEASDWDKPISLGGPVPGPMVVLHTVEELADQEVLPGVYST